MKVTITVEGKTHEVEIPAPLPACVVCSLEGRPEVAAVTREEGGNIKVVFGKRPPGWGLITPPTKDDRRVICPKCWAQFVAPVIDRTPR